MRRRQVLEILSVLLYAESILVEKGVTGFDGDQEASGACRALGCSL